MLAHGCPLVCTFLLLFVQSAELKGIDCSEPTTTSYGGCFPDNQCPCFIPAKFRAYFPADFNDILHFLADPTRGFWKKVQKSLRLRRGENMKYQDFIDLLEDALNAMLDKIAEKSSKSRYRRPYSERDAIITEHDQRKFMKFLEECLFDLEHRDNFFNLDGYRDTRYSKKSSLQKIASILDYSVMKDIADLWKTAQEKNLPPLFDLIRDSILCETRVDISKHSPFAEKLLNMVAEFLQKVEATSDNDDYLQMLNKTQLVSVHEFFLSEETFSYFKSRINTSLAPWLIQNRPQIEEEANNLKEALTVAQQAMRDTESGFHVFLNIKFRQLIGWLRKERFTEDVERYWLMQLPKVSDSFVRELEVFAADPKTEAFDKLSENYANFLHEEFKMHLENLFWKMRTLMPTPSCVKDVEKQSPQKVVQVYGTDLDYPEYFLLIALYIPAHYVGFV